MEPTKFENKTIYFTSLGCSKNLVDSEVMLGHLGLGGFKVAEQPSDAEVIIVNTCSFIESAKAESIETILDMSDYKKTENGVCKALVVAGCLSQRYSKNLEAEMPEVDLFIGTGEYTKIVPLLKAFEDGKLEKKSFVEIPKFIHTEFDPRINTSPSYMSWLKVSEGCNRNCTFCIIPTIRGRLRSRTVDSLITETRNLVKSGVKEINIISQDLSNYGYDLDENNRLLQLLSKLETVEDLAWVRLFYYYPDDLTQEVMDVIKNSKKILKYIDMPIQHFSTAVLKRMNRSITGEEIIRRVERLRATIPEIAIRTSVIVGFPGETEEDFQEILKGIQTLKFDHLGVFKYSDEDGTPAFKLKNKNSQEVIDERFERVYEIQKEIVRENNKKYLGQVLEVLVEGNHEETELLLVGRHRGQAPDIDGKVIINDGVAKVGDIVKVEITEVLDYDLVGTILEN